MSNKDQLAAEVHEQLHYELSHMGSHGPVLKANEEIDAEMNKKLGIPQSAPELETASIGSSAVNVELGIGQWTGRKKDRTASEEVTTNNNAETGVASVHKMLLGKCPELKAIHDLTGLIRNEHYAMTMPWLDTGLRLLPTKMFFSYQKHMTGRQTQWHDLVQAFLDVYQFATAKAQAQLGSLYYQAEYPTPDALARKFRFSLNYMPLPDRGDFRLDVTADVNTELATHYDTFYRERLENSYKEVWTRLFKILERMSSRLDYADTEDKKVFRDSLVENVLEMIDLLEQFNVSNNSQMSAARLALEEAMYGVTPDALREDEYLRSETKRKVDEIIKTLPTLDIL